MYDLFKSLGVLKPFLSGEGVFGELCCYVKTFLHQRTTMNVRVCFTLLMFTVYFKDVCLILSPDTVCNYTGLCTDEALRAGVSILQPQVSCCQPCICTYKCVGGNCCPESRPSLSMRAVCRDQDAMFNGYRGLPPVFIPSGSYINYYVVDSCPAGSGSKFRQACESPDELEDYVMVSSKDHSVIFKNSKCAKCNNMFDFITWKLMIYNHDIDYEDYNNDVVLRNWSQSSYVFSQPPLKHAKQLAAHECFSSYKYNCEYEVEADAMHDKCHSQPSPLYTHRGLKFPNVYCFVCASKTTKVCEDWDVWKSWTVFPFTLLVDINTLQTSVQRSNAEPRDNCGGGFMTNPVTVGSYNLTIIRHNVYLMIS